MLPFLDGAHGVVRHADLKFVVNRVTDVCEFTAPATWFRDLRQHAQVAGFSTAIACHDTPTLFDWLARFISYQGISNSIAAAYLDQHGTIGFADVAAALTAGPSCPKLASYWHFYDCRFAKIDFACAEPGHIRACPLPTHDLRNGRLNQATYALFLFVRDVCGGDLVGWLDERLTLASADVDGLQRGMNLGRAVIEPLTNVFGVSAKVVSLALSDLLLGGDPSRLLWVEAGAAMVVIDTLVHNWLHRTGSLRDMAAEHAYGPACYAAGGCADLIATAATRIDARQFCPEGPAAFPRLIQKAIWLFCAEGGQDICNGNRIDDRWPCANPACPITTCARVPLKQQ